MYAGAFSDSSSFIEVVLMLAQFIEKLREYPRLKPLEQPEKESAEKVKKRPPKHKGPTNFAF